MNTPTNKGYTLLFAVIVTVVVLSIATFVLSISRKQFILSSAARDSTTAIYAADSGIECAVENLAKLATSTYSSPITLCNAPGTGWAVTLTFGPNQSGTTTFAMPVYSGSGAAPAGSPCVTVRVGQWYVISNGQMTSSQMTAIEARGNNIGWNPSLGDCSTSAARKVERALRRLQSS